MAFKNDIFVGYKPLPDSLTIKKSPIHGLGVFAMCDISIGIDLGIAHINIVDFPQGYCRTPLGGFYNHSDEPNCELIDSDTMTFYVKRLVTIKEIAEGEELTCKYTLYSL